MCGGIQVGGPDCPLPVRGHVKKVISVPVLRLRAGSNTFFKSVHHHIAERQNLYSCIRLPPLETTVARWLQVVEKRRK